LSCDEIAANFAGRIVGGSSSRETLQSGRHPQRSLLGAAGSSHNPCPTVH
jgi:hypothetical protein